MGSKTEKFDAFFILTYVAQLEDMLSTSYINRLGVLMTAQTPLHPSLLSFNHFLSPASLARVIFHRNSLLLPLTPFAQTDAKILLPTSPPTLPIPRKLPSSNSVYSLEYPFPCSSYINSQMARSKKSNSSDKSSMFPKNSVSPKYPDFYDPLPESLQTPSSATATRL